MKIKLSFRLIVTLISILSAIFLGAVRISDPQFVEVMRLKYFDQLQKISKVNRGSNIFSYC